MCTRQLIINNPKYKPNKKNNGNPPELTNEKERTLQIPCGDCPECRKKKTNDWKIRLFEEIKAQGEENCIFVTLTFDEENLNELNLKKDDLINDKFIEYDKKTKHQRAEHPRLAKKFKEENYDNVIDDQNETAKLAVKRFRERYRKLFKKSIRHWLISEKGSKTGRLHLHGLLIGLPKDWVREAKLASGHTYSNIGLWYKGSVPKRDTSSRLAKIWKYGHIYTGWNCTEATTTYTMKYLTKKDYKNNYQGKILVSPGLGRTYITSTTKRMHKNGNNYYTNISGFKTALCRYYKTKIWSEEELHDKFIEELEQKRFTIDGYQYYVRDIEAARMVEGMMKPYIINIEKLKRHIKNRTGYEIEANQKMDNNNDFDSQHDTYYFRTNKRTTKWHNNKIKIMKIKFNVKKTLIWKKPEENIEFIKKYLIPLKYQKPIKINKNDKERKSNYVSNERNTQRNLPLLQT